MTAVDWPQRMPQVEQLIRNLYHRRSGPLLAANNLVPMKHDGAWNGFAGVDLGICVAATEELSRPGRGDTVVMTVPIHDTNGVYGRLRFDVIHNLVITLAAAAWTGAGCLIYLPIAQELILTGGAAARSRWTRYATQLSDLIDRAAAETKASVTVLRTDSPPVRARLIDAVTEHRRRLHRHQLERDRRSTGAWVRATALTTVGYLPDVIADLTDQSQPADVLVIGALTAAGAAGVARQIAAVEGCSVGFLGHLPAPSIDGRSRMARAHPDQTLILADPADITMSKIITMRDPALAYWTALRFINEQIVPGAEWDDLATMAAHYRDLYTG